MDEKTSREVLEALLACLRELDKAIEFAAAQAEPEEFRRFRALAGRAMGLIFVELIEPIYREHPILQPDYLKEGNAPMG